MTGILPLVRNLLTRPDAEALAEEYLATAPDASRGKYRRIMEKWFEWCAIYELKPLDVKRVHIEMYGTWLRSQGLSKGTLKTVYSTICLYYRYLYEEGYLDRNPGLHVKRPPTRHWSQGSWLTRDEAQRFLMLAESHPDDFVPGCCCLMLLNGTRVGETLNLDIEDWHKHESVETVRVHRKYDWMQNLAISDRTSRALERACRNRKSGPMFVRGGVRVTQPQILSVVVRLGHEAGCPERITSHSLRRTFATLAREEGVPDIQIMASGGWSSREMVDYYDMGRLSVTDNATVTVTKALENNNE